MARTAGKAATRRQKPKSGARRTVVLVATRKGAWIYHGDAARRTWRADGPHFLGHMISHLVLDPRDKRTLLVYAKYDHTFPIDLSLKLVNEFRRLEIPAEVSVLPCGHYSTGKAPFKFLDGYYLSRFLTRNL